MKYFLLSDNTDTAMGFRLAGVESCIVHQKEEFLSALNTAAADPQIGVILITNKLVTLCRDEIYRMKLTGTSPLIVEIPDRHGNSDITDSIAKYVQEAVGLRI